MTQEPQLASEPPEDASWGFGEGDEIVPGRWALERLGGGTHYEAYLAWDEHLFSLVVAKLLRPGFVADERARRGLEKEAATLDRLSHPVVMRLYGLVAEGPRPHLVMEHLEGPNLSSLLRRFGPLAHEQLLPLALQMCAALHYLGGHETVHLDIKPRNIIMTAPPRLIDFSVARTFEEARRITGTVGTDAYMAPEQCDPGRGPIGPAADVWGLGATLHHGVTGKVPFPRARDREPHDLHARFPQLEAEPTSLGPRTPPLLAEVIGACMHKDAQQRPAPAEVAEALEPLVAGLPRRPVLRRMRPRMS